MNEHPERRIVVVYDCDDMNTDQIVNMLVNPRKMKSAPKRISVVGFADAAQVRQIVGIVNGRYELPQ